MDFPPPSERQARIIWTSLTSLSLVLGLALIGVVFWGLGLLIQLLSPVLWPLAVAVVLAYLLSPVVNWLETRGISRVRALSMVFVGAGLILLGALGSIVPQAIFQARDLASQVPTFVSKLQTKVQSWLDHPPAPLRSLLPSDFQKRLDDFQDRRGPGRTNAQVDLTNAVLISQPLVLTNAEPVLTNLFGGTNAADPAAPWWVKAVNPNSLRSVGTWFAAVTPDVLRWALGQVGRVASWFGLLAGLFLIPVYAFFLLLEEKSIARTWTDYLPVADEQIKKEAVFVLRSINDALIVFFRGQVLVAMCDGVMYAVGFLLIGLPYALLIGLLACFVTIIPFLGAAVTCGLALIIAIVQFGDWQHPLLVLVVFGVVQFIEGFVLQPKIVGDRVGLHPLMVIIALMVGTTLLGGILGGILAIPLTAALKVLMAHYVWKTGSISPVDSKT
ncbi:MAG: AI-2E family transporter [Verrucomicrobia bacterium]|nr:AI-2E family transporter [Verrucomicrobiota bacterium]